MKRVITQFSKILKGAAVAVILLGANGSASAQSWCTATHQWGCAGSNYNQIDAVTIRQGTNVQTGPSIFSKAADGCQNPTTGGKDINTQSKAFSVSAGGAYTLQITQTSNWGYAGHIGLWIDLNRDGDFTDAGEWRSQGWADLNSGAVEYRNFTIPCTGVNPGLTKIRLRTEYYGYAALNANNGCGTLNYGETEDMYVQLGNPTSLSADFVVPGNPSGQLWVNTDYKFVNKNPSGYIAHDWDMQSDNVYDYSIVDATHKYTTPGTYAVKLRSRNCLGIDSTTKNVTVKAPTSVPVANFIASNTVVDQYGSSQLFDLSSNGPTGWSWFLYDSTTVGGPYIMDNTSKDPNSSDRQPLFYFNNPGKYTVCLTSTNGVGPSNQFCKKDYITVNPPSEYRIGFGASSTSVAQGIIYDHAGPSSNYGNNRSAFIDRLLILPCGATKITLKISSFRVADAGDVLKIYDSDQADAKKLIGAYSVAQNGKPFTVNAFSGAMYITFESNSGGQDSGFIGSFTSTLGPQSPPKACWSTEYCDTLYNGVEANFTNCTSNKLGLISYQWNIYDGGTLAQSLSETTSYTFYTDGRYRVTLIAQGCAGTDSFVDSIDVVTPQSKVDLDFTASNKRPAITDAVTMDALSCKANNFVWSVFPTTYVLQNGTTLFDEDPQFKFTAGGCYTFTLRAWNSIDSAKTVRTLVKDKYVCVLDYCTPLADIKSTDIGINNVKISKGSDVLLDNTSASGVDAYTNYTSTVSATLTFGASYDLAVARNTNTDPINYKAWIDFNIDGDFNDAGELVLNSGTINGKTANSTITVPFLNKSFEGISRMRVAASYSNFSNTPCGLNDVGEFEDYSIVLANDGKPPVITLVGADTVRIEKGTNYTETAYTTYSANDPTEGDITPRVVVTTDFDKNAPGIYTFVFNVEDASGNKAITKKRVVIVVLDKTAPVLSLNGVTPMTVNVDDGVTTPRGYVEPGAVAIDNVDGDITTAILISGSVNDKVVGQYTLTYKVCDVQNNCVSKDRVVNVVDVVKPVIVTPGSTNVQIGTVWVDQTYATDNYDGLIALQVTPGFNGPVNPNIRATYPITYNATDANGNKATTVNRNYRVDDFVPPVVELNTDDTIYHEVNTPYTTRNVTVSDNYYNLSQVSVVKTGSVNPYLLGMYTETYTATDASNNITVKTRYVRVVDTKNPEIWATTLNPCVGSEFNPMEGVNVLDNYYKPADLLPIVKIVNQNVNIWQAGAYSISYRVTDPSGNTSPTFTRTVYVTYWPNCAGTSVQNVELDKKVNVFPNPTSGSLKVTYDVNFAKEVNIQVFSVVGQKVADLGTVNSGLGQAEIDLGNNPDGIYLVKLTANGQTVTKKVVLKK